MRSRFAAFALGEGRYLYATLHEDHPLRAKDEATAARELSRAKQQLRYRSLTVHDAEVDGDEGRVLFTAHVFERGQDRSFSELSRFLRVDGAWRYLDGRTRPGALPESLRTVGAFERAATDGAQGA